MPLSFRRSYKKLPAVDLDRNRRRVAKTPGKKTTVEIPAEFRRRRYPAIIPIGCGLAVGICLFMLISQGYVPLPFIPEATQLDAVAISAPDLETTASAQTSAPVAPAPAETRSPVPTRTSMALPTEAASPANPWANGIPDAACIPADLPQTGRVVEVIDGDTIKVLLDGDGRVYSVRYLGVEAPTLRGASAGLGLEALAVNSELVYRKQVVMVRDVTDSDVNGTLLRYVLAGGVFVNHAMIQGGLAKVGMIAPDTACLHTLLAAEQQAQTRGRGMWSAALTPTSLP